MNENARTGIFCGVALASVLTVLLVGWVQSPASQVPTQPDESLVLKDFDPQSVTSLEIIKFDAATSQAATIKIAQVDGVWCIPSRYNYPTDSESNPLARIAGTVVGLKQLGLQTDNTSDHKLYGVVEPDPDKSQTADAGVGMRVTMRGKDDKPVFDLVIGKAVKDSPQLRYVRLPGKRQVYKAKIDADRFPTKFEDWINPDLLKVNSWDVKRISVSDYDIDLSNPAGVKMNQKGSFELTYNDAATDKKWTLSDLAPGEELDEQKLNEVASELSKLKIVDVRPKPKGVTAAVLPDGLEIAANEIQTLHECGFYIIADRQGRQYFRSQQGEREIAARDGVVYTLRFGAVTSGEGGGDKGLVTNNRYVLITVRFDEEAFPKPELKPLPGEETPLDYTVRDLRRFRQEGLLTQSEIDARKGDVEKENKRLMDEWESKIKPGKEKAERLARRFGRWYYVVSDEVFKKLHFSRDDILKKAAQPATEGATPAKTTEGEK